MNGCAGNGCALLTLFVTSLAAAGDPPVQVIVDMDGAEPGIQSTVRVPTGTTLVRGVAVYVIDPLGQREMWSIGYFGGIDRGISFGHTPTPHLNQGSVTGMDARPGQPVNPGNVGWIVRPPGMQPGFEGPEIQYIEGGATSAAVIPPTPAAPVLTADIALDGAWPGDRFSFYLLDLISVWSAGTAGAFSTRGPAVTLDTGGDAVPDVTLTIYGVDPDVPVPVPPASFLVDYIDGPPATGPAVIEVIPALGDVNGDGRINVLDLLQVLAAWGPCSGCPEDLDGNNVVNVLDLLIVLAHWGDGTALTDDGSRD